MSKILITSVTKNLLSQSAEDGDRETKLFKVSRGWLHRFRNMFNLKNFKIIGDAASADEESAATFPAVFKKNYPGGKIRY